MREVNVFKWEQQVIDGCRKSVKVLNKVALFHRFGQEADGEGQSNPVAIVECASGQVETVYVQMIEFVAGPKGADTCTSLRDYFAAKALPALISEPVPQGGDSTAASICHDAGQLQDTVEALLAFAAYRIADAMLAERAK